MIRDIFKVMEEELEKMRVNEEMDEIFFGMIEHFIEGGETTEDGTYSEKIGKTMIQMHAKVMVGEDDEENCVYVEWMKIGDKVFEIRDYFA